MPTQGYINALNRGDDVAPIPHGTIGNLLSDVVGEVGSVLRGGIRAAKDVVHEGYEDLRSGTKMVSSGLIDAGNYFKPKTFEVDPTRGVFGLPLAGSAQKDGDPLADTEGIIDGKLHTFGQGEYSITPNPDLKLTQYGQSFSSEDLAMRGDVSFYNEMGNLFARVKADFGTGTREERWRWDPFLERFKMYGEPSDINPVGNEGDPKLYLRSHNLTNATLPNDPPVPTVIQSMIDPSSYVPTHTRDGGNAAYTSLNPMPNTPVVTIPKITTGLHRGVPVNYSEERDPNTNYMDGTGSVTYSPDYSNEFNPKALHEFHRQEVQKFYNPNPESSEQLPGACTKNGCPYPTPSDARLHPDFDWIRPGAEWASVTHKQDFPSFGIQSQTVRPGWD